MSMVCRTGALTNYAEQKIVGHIVNNPAWTPPTKLYVALGTLGSDPEAGDFNECMGGGYARQRIHFSEPTSTPTPSCVTSVTNKCPLYFGPADGDWALVNHIGIYDSKTGGNLIAYGPLDSSNWYVKEDQQLYIAVDEIKTGLSKRNDIEGWSTYLQDKMVRHVFLNEYYTPPTIYAAITGDKPNCDADGSNLDEPSDSAYSRPVPSWTTAVQSSHFPDFSESGVKPPAPLFGTASQDWYFPSPQKFVVYCDQAKGAGTPAGGNMLAYASTSISQIIRAGDTVFLSSENSNYNVLAAH